MISRSEKIIRRNGLTIIEVMISLVILGGCLAVIGEVARLAFRNARESRDMTQAELLAENILAKVRLGIIEMKPVSNTPITNQTSTYNDTIEDTGVINENDSNDVLWLYSIDITNVEDSDKLIEIGITVTQNPDRTTHPVKCYLLRWIIDETENTTDQN
ncbi:MAG: prepilin-type N-terminal cleavage/methylation domain-containing protein [Planctomycetaceae bacterium]|jgi:prepilin-type N-terminal cleavage/methylation domain-containing protein|nr:prepilin-type N-terminal cleavage/methylation domain-containing protein [Planctomycetaceae bacterium]